MKHLLTVRYPHDKNCYQKNLSYPVRQEYGLFTLHDAIACQICKSHFVEKINCTSAVLTIHANNPVDVLCFERFISQFDGTSAEIKDRCDYLLYDHDAQKQKIAFCELTCSESKYLEPNASNKQPEGKRAKAYSQMKTSLEALLTVSMLCVHILTRPKKYAIFGWRERNVQFPMDQAATSMKEFTITPSSASNVLYSDVFVMGHGFTFAQIKYPTVYEW